MTTADSNDTICAISTPPGVGGIAVARVSGPQAIEVTSRIWQGRPLDGVDSHTAHLGNVTDSRGEMLDQAVATVFVAPKSFTGETVVELAVHGSRFVQRELIASLIKAGARLAEPGEFTRRAFAAGKMDLAEAEAVADVIASNSRAAHRIAISQMKGGFSKRIADLRAKLIDLASLLELELDFSEEEVEFASRTQLRQLASQLNDEISRLHRSFATGNAIKEGIPVAIVGPTNAGKSSLLNALLGDERAIVSDIHGTTRDTIEETLELGDYLFRFIDTAGIRDTADTIERIGIDRSLQAIDKARIIIIVTDATSPLPRDIIDRAVQTQSQSDTPPAIILLRNKIDRLDTAESEIDISETLSTPTEGRIEIIPISALTGQGLTTLTDRLQDAARRDCGTADEDTLVTNLRHAQALAQAHQSTTRLLQGLATNLPGDLLAQDLREALHHLSAITGQIPSTEILATIFSRFCIGK